MRHTHCRTRNMAKKLTNVENETQTQFYLDNGEEHSKKWKMRNTHCRTWNMGKKLKKKKKNGKWYTNTV